MCCVVKYPIHGVLPYANDNEIGIPMTKTRIEQLLKMDE